MVLVDWIVTEFLLPGFTRGAESVVKANQLTDTAGGAGGKPVMSSLQHSANINILHIEKILCLLFLLRQIIRITHFCA